MNFNNRTKTGTTPFQNLDAETALTEIADESATIYSGGASITLFEDDNFQGDATVRTINDSDLRFGPFQGWNDITSSIIVNSGTWKVFENADFDVKGRSQVLSSKGGAKKDGRYTLADLKNIGNDTISSILIV